MKLIDLFLSGVSNLIHFDGGSQNTGHLDTEGEKREISTAIVKRSDETKSLDDLTKNIFTERDLGESIRVTKEINRNNICSFLHGEFTEPLSLVNVHTFISTILQQDFCTTSNYKGDIMISTKGSNDTLLGSVNGTLKSKPLAEKREMKQNRGSDHTGNLVSTGHLTEVGSIRVAVELGER